jgi:hypothetical protein
MAIQKKSLITNLSATKKAVVASNSHKVASAQGITASPARKALATKARVLSPRKLTRSMAPASKSSLK